MQLQPNHLQKNRSKRTPKIRIKAKLSLGKRFTRAVTKDYQLYILLAPIIIYFILFHYLPLYGIQIAFRDYKAVKGILGSSWVGLKHYENFFNTYYSSRLLINTFMLNILGIICGFPVPIILAILLNQFEVSRFRRFTQTIIYVPHFISTTVMVSMLYLFLSPSNGIINKFIETLGVKPIFFMVESSWFRPLFIASDIWQHAGWSTILFIAALTGIDPSLYEAASIDGANKRQKILYIDLPHLIPIVVLMLILRFGAMLVSNTDKALLMQTPGNMSTSDIIGVYVYQQGLTKGQFSYTSAIGLLVNVINFVMIISVNWIARRVGQTSLF